MTKGDKQLLSDIEEFGWHVVKILEDDKGPGFCYSIGLFETFNHPEIIIVGPNLDLAHTLINNIGEDLKNGMGYETGKLYPDILDGFDCLMLKVKEEHYKQHFGYAQWYYKNKSFPVLQCIYPTVKGVYPWEAHWPENIKDLQPILGDFKN